MRGRGSEGGSDGANFSEKLGHILLISVELQDIHQEFKGLGDLQI